MEAIVEDSVFVVEDGTIQEKIFTRQEIEILLQTRNPRVKLEQLKGSFSEVWRYMGVVQSKQLSVCTADLRPFSVFSCEGMSAYSQHLINMGAKYGQINIKDILSSRNKLSGDVLDNVYDRKVAELKVELARVIRCGATMDFGKEKMNNIDFVDLTLHFIDEVNYTRI